jgi:hypothetical protein
LRGRTGTGRFGSPRTGTGTGTEKTNYLRTGTETGTEKRELSRTGTGTGTDKIYFYFFRFAVPKIFLNLFPVI